MIKLNKAVNEGSTLVATLTFTDDSGLAVLPLTTTWELYNTDGEVVNGRASVHVTPAQVLNITLTGNDLVVNDARKFETMTLIVRATYNSSRGAGLSITESLVFQVNRLKA